MRLVGAFQPPAQSVALRDRFEERREVGEVEVEAGAEDVFAEEAFRVLKPEGVMFCKIADYVHGHRFQWAHIEFISAAKLVGFCPCDSIVKVRKGPIVSPRWKNAHHARRQHCYWLVLRKSDKCE